MPLSYSNVASDEMPVIWRLVTKELPFTARLADRPAGRPRARTAIAVAAPVGDGRTVTLRR
jgi:hypothetical protein